MATDTLQRALSIQTDVRAMRATVRVAADADYSAVIPADILEIAERARIRLTDAVRARAVELAERLRAGDIPAEELLLAEGTPPTEPQDAELIFADSEETQDPDEQDSEPDRIDFYRQCRIRTVLEGGVIGRLRPAAPGTPGVDVFGKSVPPERKPREIELGENVEVDADGQVRAKVSGKVHFVGGRLSVQPVIEIKGDVNFETGSIDTPTDVLIRGNVLDGFYVRGARNVTVGGAIGAAEVRAGADVQANGGIAGKGKGSIEAGGHVVAKFCDECSVRAGGDVSVAKEILNSTIHARGRLRLAAGALIGGYAHARCGAEIRAAGSDGNVKTTISVGIDPAVLEKCREIDEQVNKRKEAAAKIRQTVEPLLAQLKRLLPAQRERATELMYEADRIEASIQDLLNQKDAMLKESTPEEPAYLLVSSKAYSGVTIIIGDRMTTLTRDLSGPVRIMRRRVNRVDEIVAINDATGHLQVLGSREVHIGSD